MPKVALYNMDGNEVGDIELNDSIFGIKVNTSVIHDVVVNYLANQRQGTQNTKTRAEVRGGGIKPWRQKGTGRARQGSIRAPHFTGGGVALGPKPRKYDYVLNKKVKRLALKSALSSKVLENQIIVLENLSLESIKTKEIAKMLDKLNAGSKALIVTPAKDENIYKSARNIYGVKATFVNTLNVYDVMRYDKFIISKEAVERLEEVYA